ncbi:hypothetical protein RIR_jg24163.t1 [Rhizophagus irregularis DAOM 181602=DAOM 197198]|nr:hypothetical protein RIR_jg24163.t1 [Rhizophagus irregularis DAOM 181602=DAOM 197198]
MFEIVTMVWSRPQLCWRSIIFRSVIPPILSLCTSKICCSTTYHIHWAEILEKCIQQVVNQALFQMLILLVHSSLLHLETAWKLFLVPLPNHIKVHQFHHHILHNII